MNALTELQAIAVEVLAALDTGNRIQPFGDFAGGCVALRLRWLEHDGFSAADSSSLNN
jgi:hypothetical protein